MITAPARDDLLLLRPAEDVVVVPNQLDLRLVGVRAGKPEIDVVQSFGCTLCDHVCECDGGLARMACIGVIIGELARLLGDGFGDLQPPISDIDAVKSGKSVEAAPPFTIDHIDALAASHDAVRTLAARMRTHSGGGMEEMLAVPDFERIAILEHGFPRPSNSWWRHAG